MRLCRALLLLSSFSFCSAQNVLQAKHSLPATDVNVTPELLAHQLTGSYTTQLDKVRSIFRWITGNISYRVRKRYWLKSTVTSQPDDEDTSSVLKPLNERIAENVLRNNEAVCDGYARLFTVLCNYAGIKSEVVTGYARINGYKPGSKFWSNHSWNAVSIDSSWYLLDATWASGYVSFSDEFVRRYNDDYFLTPPAQFVQEHYPENLKWTLLNDPPVLKEFRNSPFKSQRFIKAGVVSYKPENGIIVSSVGDTIVINMEIERLRINTDGSPDTTSDFSTESHPAAWAFIKPDDLVTSKKIRYTYIVSSPEVEWLNLLLYDDVIMRYRVNIIKK